MPCPLLLPGVGAVLVRQANRVGKRLERGLSGCKFVSGCNGLR